MNWLITLLLALLDVTDLRAPNPAVAAMRRARLCALICIVGAGLFLGVAYAEFPDAAVSPLVRPFKELMVEIALGGAAFCTAWLVWFLWRWERAYSRPELYLD